MCGFTFTVFLSPSSSFRRPLRILDLGGDKFAAGSSSPPDVGVGSLRAFTGALGDRIGAEDARRLQPRATSSQDLRGRTLLADARRLVFVYGSSGPGCSPLPRLHDGAHPVARRAEGFDTGNGDDAGVAWPGLGLLLYGRVDLVCASAAVLNLVMAGSRSRFRRRTCRLRSGEKARDSWSGRCSGWRPALPDVVRYGAVVSFAALWTSRRRDARGSGSRPLRCVSSAGFSGRLADASARAAPLRLRLGRSRSFPRLRDDAGASSARRPSTADLRKRLHVLRGVLLKHVPSERRARRSRHHRGVRHGIGTGSMALGRWRSGRLRERFPVAARSRSSRRRLPSCGAPISPEETAARLGFAGNLPSREEAPARRDRGSRTGVGFRRRLPLARRRLAAGS